MTVDKEKKSQKQEEKKKNRRAWRERGCWEMKTNKKIMLKINYEGQNCSFVFKFSVGGDEGGDNWLIIVIHFTVHWF